MPQRHHIAALLATVAALSALGLAPAGAPAAPRAHAAGACAIRGKEQSLGPTLSLIHI